MTDTMTETNTTLDLDVACLRDALTASLAVASKDPTIPALNAVRFECAAGELALTATDRYQLLTATMPVSDTAQSWAINLTREDATRLAAGLKGLKFYALLSHADDQLTVKTLDGTAFALRHSDMQFPNVAALYPTNEPVPVTQMAFNPTNLTTLAKMPGRLGRGRNSQPVKLSFYGEHKPSRSQWGEVGTRPNPSVAYDYLVVPVRVP